jgi:hypothetical protein
MAALTSADGQVHLVPVPHVNLSSAPCPARLGELTPVNPALYPGYRAGVRPFCLVPTGRIGGSSPHRGGVNDLRNGGKTAENSQL